MHCVARRGYCFVENQKTVLVPVLVRLGALEYEDDAGNDVYRCTREGVGRFLERLGASSHEVETAWFLQVLPFLALSRPVPGQLPLYLIQAFVRLINAFTGQWGNAFCVVVEK